MWKMPEEASGPLEQGCGWFLFLNNFLCFLLGMCCFFSRQLALKLGRLVSQDLSGNLRLNCKSSFSSSVPCNLSHWPGFSRLLDFRV